MKKNLLIPVLLFSLTASIHAQETLLEMDMTKTKNGTLETWIYNKAISKSGKVTVEKDANGKNYLTTKGWGHYYYPKLFNVNESDTAVVSLRVRGKGTVNVGYYIFGKHDKFFGAFGKRFTLTPEWKTVSAEIPLGYVADAKGGLRGYPNRLRPLVETAGEKVDFADYKLSVKRNPALKGWTLDSLKSDAKVKPSADGVEIPGPGKVEYTALAISKSSFGEKLVISMELKGKGSIKAGAYFYDIKYNPNRKGSTSSGDSSETKKLDSANWTKLSCSVPVKNASKEGSVSYTNRILPFIVFDADAGSVITVKNASFKIEKENLSLPEI